MTDHINILPCAHCGSPADLFSTAGDDTIECSLCGAQMIGPTVPAVKVKWNTRASSDLTKRLAEALRECHEIMAATNRPTTSCAMAMEKNKTILAEYDSTTPGAPK